MSTYKSTDFGSHEELVTFLNKQLVNAGGEGFYFQIIDIAYNPEDRYYYLIYLSND